MGRESFYLKYGKRLVDVVVAVLTVVVLSPVMVVISIAILISSGWPIIYKQNRVGRNCEDFVIYKFRTMVLNADRIGPTSTAVGDNRITKIGQFLRKTSLDELPQFFNVLIGNMSLVGYRPDVRRGGEKADDEKYKLKPGITGFAQIRGRSCLSIEDKRKLERKYATEVSFILDIKVVLYTIKIVLKRQGSN